MNIHPLAVVSPQARLGRSVLVGPFSIVEPNVVIGDRCKLESHVVVKEGTRLGDDNHVFEGAVLGAKPQHLKAPTQLGDVVIGSGNVLREHVTIHRAVKAGTTTEVGDNNFLMVGAHVAHDCRLGSHIIMANGSMLGGHVTVDDRAFISGAVAVHQFCRIGSLAMVGGHARVVQDVPPYVTVDGISGHIVGLNLIGLRRSGFTGEEVQQLKLAYRLIYRSGLKWTEILAQLRSEFNTGRAAEFERFLSGGTRGFVQERRVPPGATIKLRRQGEDVASEESELKTKAG